jgi:lysophospholipase L1-like esterase
LETPPSQTVVVIGDSMADWLGNGLDENYAEQPEIGVDRKIRATSGLVRYDAKNEALDWPQAAKDALSNAKPNAIMVMLGLNDRVPLREKAPAEPKRNDEPANRQAIRAPARRSTIIITTTPDDITAGTVDITTAGTTAGNLRRVASRNNERQIPYPNRRSEEAKTRPRSVTPDPSFCGGEATLQGGRFARPHDATDGVSCGSGFVLAGARLFADRAVFFCFG